MDLFFAVLFTLPCLMISAVVCEYANYRWRWPSQPWVMVAGGLALLAVLDQLGVTDWLIQNLS